MSAASSTLHSSSYNQNNSKKSYGRSRSRGGHTTLADSTETDDNSNLVRLCINKPESWNWELTTSKSSPSIAFPLIQLYDKSSGALLAETNEAECRIRGAGCAAPESRRRKGSFRGEARRANIPAIIAESRDDDEELLSNSGQLPLKVSHCRSRSWQNDEISGDKQQQQQPRTRSSSSGKRKLAAVNGLNEVLNGIVDQYAKEGVNCKLNFHNRRRNSGNGAEEEHQQSQHAISRSKSTTYVPVSKAHSNSSSCSTGRKKKYRRAASTNSLRFSNSILERIREYKRCASSTSSSSGGSAAEDEVENAVPHDVGDGPGSRHLSLEKEKMKRKIRMVHSATDIPAEQADQAAEEDVYRPKYTLRTSKAGTIVVCEESFRHRKVRRRPRSLTRSNEPAEDAPEVVVFSPERVKTMYEYVGRAEQSGSESGRGENRYQREIDNIDKMLTELKAEEARSGKSSLTRRHKSFTDQKQQQLGTEAANSKRGTIRFNSHQSSSGKLSIDDDEKEEEKKMDSKAKRISFGRTIFKTKSTEDDGMDINDADNRSGVVAQTDGMMMMAGKSQRECSDKDKSRATRNQVRRTRRSFSADLIVRLNDPVLSSSTQSEDSDCGNTSEKSNGRRRGRSRTKRRPPIQRQPGVVVGHHDHDGSEHKLIVQGDQVVAINKPASSSSSSLGKSIKKEQQGTQSPCLIEPTDQVLLRLVRRLASLQTHHHHQSHDQTKSISDNQGKLSWLSRSTNQELSFDTSGGGGVEGCGSQLDINNNQNNNNNRDKENMGSNVSRHNGKGLSGRRSLSSGNIFNGKPMPNQSPVVVASAAKGAADPRGGGGAARINKRFHGLVPDTISSGGQERDTCLVNQQSPTMMIMSSGGSNKRERNHLCGSLPNYLDDAAGEEEEDVDQLQLTDSCRDAPGTPNNDESLSKVEYVTVATSRQPSMTNNINNNDFVGGAVRPPGSPYNTSSSGKGSIASSSNLGSSSTFKSSTNGDPVPPSSRLELKLPVQQHRVNFDTGCDQGYGSERSPEEEVPPTLPSLLTNGCEDPFNLMNGGPPALMMMMMGPPPNPGEPSSSSLVDEGGNQIRSTEDRFDCGYEFITKDCTFLVQIIKGARGLGLSISGGVDSNAAFPGLIRIKRLFPHQAAWATGQLQPGDIILEVNGQPLSGMTNYEALEVLRTAPNDITLTVCRPEDEHYRKLSPPSDPPRPPERTLHPPCSLPLEPLTPLQTSFNGEFELIMVKQQGSLGFTLRKEDDSVLGHYVRALVRKPATDGIIKPGDKIVAVNDVPLSPMSHEEAVIFLRQADDTVKLRLYRDVAQTPVAAMSPTNPEKGFASTLKARQFLRPEAINLLSDLAYRKQTPPCGSSGSSVNSGSNTSPRRLKRGVIKGPARTASHGQGTMSQFSDSEASTLSQGSFRIQPVGGTNYGSSAEETYTIIEDGPESADFESISDDQQYYRSEEIQDVVLDDDCDVYSTDSSCRPSYLNLAGGGGSGRNQRYAPFELNNLDNDLLDAPMYKHLPGSPSAAAAVMDQNSMSDSQDFVSLPCDTFIVAENELKRRGVEKSPFQHKNPVYQSVQMNNVGGTGGGVKEASTISGGVGGGEGAGSAQKEGTKSSLMKWKGVILAAGGEAGGESHSLDGITASSVVDECGRTTNAEEDEGAEEQITTAIKPNNAINFSGYKPPMTLELNRGWNSRLGFSLRLNEETHRTYISAIYSDSVAARDGRLRIGDEIIRVNDESVENMSTAQIIDLLRIIRGAICLTVLRKEDEEDSPAAAAVESA